MLCAVSRAVTSELGMRRQGLGRHAGLMKFTHKRCDSAERFWQNLQLHPARHGLPFVYNCAVPHGNNTFRKVSALSIVQSAYSRAGYQ